MNALELLRKEVKETSMGKVAKRLKISKATVSLLYRNKYPNTYKMYSKIKQEYKQEIIGVEATTNNLQELIKEIG